MRRKLKKVKFMNSFRLSGQTTNYSHQSGAGETGRDLLALFGDAKWQNPV
jgi:hypothetical protein